MDRSRTMGIGRFLVVYLGVMALIVLGVFAPEIGRALQMRGFPVEAASAAGVVLFVAFWTVVIGKAVRDHYR